MAQLPIIMIQIKHAEKTKFLWPCPGSKIRSRSKWKVSTMIVQLIGTKYVNGFLWPCPGSKIKSKSKWKVCCTSTMIVQLIGTKYVQICEAVWAESRAQSTTRIRDAWTHRRTDGRTWILCPRSGHSPRRGQKYHFKYVVQDVWYFTLTTCKATEIDKLFTRKRIISLIIFQIMNERMNERTNKSRNESINEWNLKHLSLWTPPCSQTHSGCYNNHKSTFCYLNRKLNSHSSNRY